MEPKTLIEKFGEEVNLKFFASFPILTTAITSEVLEVAKIRFLDYVKEHIIMWESSEVQPLEFNSIPFGSKKCPFEKICPTETTTNVNTEAQMNEKRIIEQILNVAAFSLMRSGYFKSPIIIFEKQDNLNFAIKMNDFPRELSNKLTYALSPRIHYLLEKSHYESAIVNMLSQKNFIILHGRGYAFLKSHLLVEGKERPVLKQEVQYLYKFGMGRIKKEEFLENSSKFRYFKIVQVKDRKEYEFAEDERLKGNK
jgi:hypothetical protein